MFFEDTLKEVIEALKEITFEEEIDQNTQIKDLGLDSLGFLELFFRIQTILGVEISQQDLQDLLVKKLLLKLQKQEINLKKIDSFEALPFFELIADLTIIELAEIIVELVEDGSFKSLKESPLNYNLDNSFLKKQEQFLEKYALAINEIDKDKALRHFASVIKAQSISQQDLKLKEYLHFFKGLRLND